MDQMDNELQCSEAMWAIHETVIPSLCELAADYARRISPSDDYQNEEIRAAIFHMAVENLHILAPLMDELTKHTKALLNGSKG